MMRLLDKEINDDIEILSFLGGIFKRVSTEYKQQYYFCGVRLWSCYISSLDIVRSEIKKSNLHNIVADIKYSIEKNITNLVADAKNFSKEIKSIEDEFLKLNQIFEEKINLLHQENLSIRQILEEKVNLLQRENMSIKHKYQVMEKYIACLENKILDINDKLDIVNQFIKTSSIIKFNDETLPLMKSGFYGVENWGCWLKKYAILFLKVIPFQTDVHLTLSLNCFHPETEKTLCIWANGRKIGKYISSQGDNMISVTISKLNIPENGFISLVFVTDKLETPQELFDVADTRALGFGLIQLTADIEMLLFDLDKDLFQALYQQRYSCKFKNEEWFTYFDTHDIESDLLKLKRNLSEDNQILIDEFYRRRCASYVFSAYEVKQHELVLAQDISKYKIVNQEGFQPEVFYFKNGLTFIDDNIVKTHLSDKDIIDGGACSGDSTLMFAEYKYINKIYSFEPMVESFEGLKKTLKVNNCLKAQAVHKALSNINGTTEILGQICQTITVDTFAKDKKIGCIKFDLEGMETKALWGAEQTIKRDKPLLLICLYHTPEDFFCVKPIIESWNLGYKFKIVDTEPCNQAIGVHLTLIAYQE